MRTDKRSARKSQATRGRITKASMAVVAVAAIISLGFGLGLSRSATAQDPDPCVFPGADDLRVKAFLEAGCYKGWEHDGEIRRTGPIIDGVDFFTHGRARVYYSPEVMTWLLADRPEGGLPAGAMIVKENWPPLPEIDPPDPTTLFWTTMVRIPAGSWDGWYWHTAKTGPEGQNVGRFGYAVCITCHASADNKELTFSTLRNVYGEPDRYDTPDESWAYLTEHSLLQTSASPIHSQQFDPPPPSPLNQALTTPSPEFLRRFNQITGRSADGLRALPPRTGDHVVASADGPARFLTSSQCQGCHDAGEHLDNLMPPMMFVDSQGRRVNVSPFSEWSVSLMGLSGRDPVFHAQLESERVLWPAMAGFSDDTCFRCHGGMGQRQLHLDRGESFSHDMIYATSGSHGTYGALARDGISCTMCHAIAPEGLGTPATYTGLFNTEPANEIVGPYVDPKTYPMVQALGITPKGGDHLSSSALCGSCHTVILPQVPGPFRGADPTKDSSIGFEHEQTTYLEWRNSIYQDEREPVNPAVAQSCQSCHMPRTHEGRDLSFRIANIQDQTYPPVDNLAGEEEIGLIDRVPYARHVLVGLNLFVMQMFEQFSSILGVANRDGRMPSGTENPMVTAQASVLQLAREQTATLEITSVQRTATSLEVDVRATNLAGHKFPSGVGFRRAFIELTVRGAGGQALWGSGQADSLGVILDGRGVPLETEFSKRLWQPHHEVIERQDQTQIYEERHLDDAGELTTSFFGLFSKVKDNRITPRGWDPRGPDIHEMEPIGAEQDSRYHDGSGSDELRYRIALDEIPNAVTVEARLYYQSIPPYYLRDRFAIAPDGPETQRLHYITSHLNTQGTPIENWRLLISSASRPAN